MRFLISFILILAIAPAHAGMDCPSRADGEIIIGTFNVYILGNLAEKYTNPETLNSPEIPKRITAISDVIAVGAFDLVAIQELEYGDPGKAAMRDLVATLKTRHGINYDYFVSDNIGYGFRMYESMAFMFKAEVVTPQVIPGTNKYTQLIPIDGRDLVRTKWLTGNFDFTLISAHLAWGNESKRIDGYQEIDMIFSTPTPSKYSQDPDIIVLGDFNRFGDEQESVKHLKYDGDFSAPNITIFDPNFNEIVEPTFSHASGLGLPNDDPQWLSTTISDDNAKVYDIVMLSPSVAEKFTGGPSGGQFGQDWGILHFDEVGGCSHQPGWEQLGHDPMKELVSDHRPLWMKFSVQ